MQKLSCLLKKFKSGEISYKYLLNAVEQYDCLYENSKFLCALGSPIKSSKDFQKAQKDMLETVYFSLKTIDYVSETGERCATSAPSEDRKQATKEIAKKYAIRPESLNKDLE